MGDILDNFYKVQKASATPASTVASVNFPVSSSPAITPTVGASSALKSLADQIAEEQRRLEAQEKLAREELLTTRGTTGSETGVGAALAALPILIGLAAKGKKGGAIGAQVGALGSQQFFSGLDKEKQKKEKLAELTLSDIQKQRAGLTREGTRLQIEDARIASREEEGAKNRASREKIGSTKITIKNLPGDVQEDVAKAESYGASIQDSLNHINRYFRDEKAIENLSSIQGVENLAKRKLSEFTEPDSPSGQLRTMLENIILEYQASKIKGVASDKDLRRVEAIVNGSAPISTIPALIKNLERLRDTTYRYADTRIKVAQDFMREPGQESVQRAPIEQPITTDAKGQKYFIDAVNKKLIRIPE